jgi:hypothetical protein
MKSLKDYIKEKDKDDPCQDGYEQFGMKDKNGKEVPNCIPEEDKEINEKKGEYEGREVTLEDPFRLKNDDKKFGVYVKNDKGNVVMVKFGDADMEIKRDDDEARESFRARHKCDQKKDKTSAGYWSCKMWQKGSSVSDVLESEAPTNVTTGVANPDGPRFKKTKFAGYPCVEVDSDTYVRCSQGKKKYARWKGYVEDEDLRQFVKKNFQKEKKLVIKDSGSGAMSFIKR